MMFQVMQLKGVAPGSWGWVSLASFTSKEEAEAFIRARGNLSGIAIWQVPAEIVG